MANEEVLGPRKTMFVLVIVVGCFAVLWPRILSPLILGHTRDQLKPNQYDRDAALKQERPIMRGAGPHPALRERGRAIPAGAPTPPSRGPVPLPAHARVRSSPLSVYFELDIKPPPIPGMRPPLGSPGGPVAAPKSSMGFVMPIYTICIIVFFVYTLSKILFKRTGSVPYEPIQPDPQFRRRVFRDDSRSSPDTKLGPKERDTIVTAISGLVAEVQQQMEASYAPNQQRQDVQDNLTRPYTNGTVLGNSTTPVQIIASEYREPSKEKSPEPQKEKEQSPEPVPKPKVPIPEPEPQESKPAPEPVQEDESNESNEAREPTPEGKEQAKTQPAVTPESVETKTEPDIDLFKLTEDIVKKDADLLVTSTNDFLDNAREEFKILSTPDLEERTKEKQSTQELLEEALKEDSPTKERDVTEDQENASVKVVGMELTAHTADGGAWPRAEPPPVTPLPPQRPPHEAEEVKSIYLETEIPQQSRVLVTDFVEDTADRPTPTKHSPLNKENYLQQLVVSGKMTLSLIQDAPRETPERDLESTMDEFTTASAVTQPAAEKEGNLSEDEVDEEIEVEEIEVEEIEDEEEPLKIEDVMIAEKIEELKAAAEEIDEIKEAAEKNETDELVVVQKIKVKESADETNEVIESPEEIEELKEKVETLEYVERAAETIEVQEAAERIEEVKEAVEETEVEETLEKTDEVKETAEEPEVKEIFEKIEKIKEAAENTREVKDVIEKTDEVKETIEEIDGMMEAAEETEELKEAAEKTDEVKETVEELEVVKETTGETEELKEAVKEIEQLKEPVEETEEVKEIVEEIEEVKETTGETEELKEAVKEIEEVKEPVEKTDELKEIEVKETAGKIEELKETVKKTEEVAEVADKSDEAKETVEEKKEVKEAAENIEEVKEAAATTEEVKEAPKKSGKRRKRGKRTEESDKSQELEK